MGRIISSLKCLSLMLPLGHNYPCIHVHLPFLLTTKQLPLRVLLIIIMCRLRTFFGNKTWT